MDSTPIRRSPHAPSDRQQRHVSRYAPAQPHAGCPGTAEPEPLPDVPLTDQQADAPPPVDPVPPAPPVQQIIRQIKTVLIEVPLCDNPPGLDGTPSFCKAHVNLQLIKSRSATGRQPPASPLVGPEGDRGEARQRPQGLQPQRRRGLADRAVGRTGVAGTDQRHRLATHDPSNGLRPNGPRQCMALSVLLFIARSWCAAFCGALFARPPAVQISCVFLGSLLQVCPVCAFAARCCSSVRAGTGFWFRIFVIRRGCHSWASR